MSVIPSPAISAWLADFHKRNGRAPAVLHIGNIANAAYLNASMMNALGLDCDLLCYDYYHIMGCPEWESAAFDSTQIADQARPKWSEIDLNGFERPRWFAQGSIGSCLDYLIVRRTPGADANTLWERLAFEREGAQLDGDSDGEIVSQVDLRARRSALAVAFAADFPLRRDQLHEDELIGHFALVDRYFARLQHLLSLYDVVVGYATDGILPLAVGKRPYISYEHGTIRALPFEDSTAGRLCALTYSRADITIITNCDAVTAAEKLNILDYRFVPHPINENVPTQARSAGLRQELRERLGTDFIIFHPSRQHWGPERHPSWEKGNDIFLKGFARFVKEDSPAAAAVLVDWGITADASKSLIADLGIADRVIWVSPQNASGMASYIQATEVLADQFFLGAWGSTMPRALYFGTPAMLYVNEKVHEWCFSEMPPIVNVRTSEEVHKGLRSLLDVEYRHEVVRRARRWYDKYHSNQIVADGLVEAVKDALKRDQPSQTAALARDVRDIRQAQITELALLKEHRSVEESLAAQMLLRIRPMVPHIERVRHLIRAGFGPPFRAARRLRRRVSAG